MVENKLVDRNLFKLLKRINLNKKPSINLHYTPPSSSPTPTTLKKLIPKKATDLKKIKMLKFSYFVATIKNIKTRAKQRKKSNSRHSKNTY